MKELGFILGSLMFFCVLGVIVCHLTFGIAVDWLIPDIGHFSNFHPF